jgi:hypothetical protein
MRIQRRHLSVFFLVAMVCFVIALLIATGTVNSTRETAWLVGGLLSLSIGLLGSGG